MTEEQANSPRSHETLISLLKSVDSLDSKNDLEKLFSTIPNSGRFGPDVRSSLRASVGKLGRYYSTCNFLIIAARRLPIFRSIRVESARLPMPVSSPLWITQDPTISATLDRILKAQTNRRSQRWAPSIASAETKFRSQLAASPNSYTVHAEIQLLFYYQMHPEIRRPRVICSSKSACFLCDLFVKLHAKFYVARTHGVLYNKWILPDWRTIHLPGEGIKDLTRVVEQLNVTLEDRIRSTLPIPRIPRSHPNESVLIVPALWTPSAVSLASSTGPQVIAGSQHSAGYLKDHPELMANVGAFRSCPPRSTTADQGAVDRGWSSNDRTSSRPALENGGCSDFLTSASSVEVPTVDPEGSLEPRGRQDEIINSDIVRTSPTSQYHFDRPTWASSRSPRSTPRDGFISKLPVRHKMKVDYSEYRNPKSSVSVHHLNTSSPIPCLGVVAPNYEPLIQGIWIERELPTFGPPVKLSTRLIHVTLSYDWAEVTHKLATVERQEKRQESSRSEKGYLVQVKWLGSEEEPRRSSEQRSNIVDLDDMDENLEETLSHGAASSSTELYIHRRFDMIAIKFILEE